MNKDDKQKATSNRGSLTAIFLTVFIDLLGFGIVLPLLPIYGKYFAAEHGLTGSQTGLLIGLLMSAFSAMQFVFLPFWGRLSDRFGRRPILLIGLCGSTFFYALFGVATMKRSLVWLFVSRIGAGIAGATISTAQAYIADTTTAKNRTHGMALIGAAFALGFTVGPVIGGISLFIGDQAAMSPWPGYIAADLSAGAFFLAFFRLPESRTPASERAERTLLDREGLYVALHVRSIRFLVLTSFIAITSFAAFESTLSLEIKRLCEQFFASASASGGSLGQMIHWVESLGYRDLERSQLAIVLISFTYLGLIMTLAQGFLVRRMAKKTTEGAMAIGGSLTSAIGFVLISLAVYASSYALLCLAMAVIVVGFSFITPAIQALISRRTSPDQQGHVLGLAQSISSLARIIGPVLGIGLYFSQPVVPFAGSTLVMVLAAALILRAVRSGKDYA